MEAKFAKRLLKLADYLDTVPRKLFDYGAWGYDKPKCGTVACALGHACMMPEFHRLGARLVPSECHDEQEYYPEMAGRTNSTSWDVSAEIFGLTFDSHDELFCGSGKGAPSMDTATPKQMAKYIRKYVAAR